MFYLEGEKLVNLVWIKVWFKAVVFSGFNNDLLKVVEEADVGASFSIGKMLGNIPFVMGVGDIVHGAITNNGEIEQENPPS